MPLNPVGSPEPPPDDASGGFVINLALRPPSLQNNTADADRLTTALKSALAAGDIRIDISLLAELPPTLRREGFQVRCLVFNDGRFWHLLEVLPRQKPLRFIGGLAVDLGTTRGVLRAVDLTSQKILGETSFINPQVGIAPDILARIHFSAAPEGRRRLNDMLISELNQALSDLCHTAGLETNDIYLVSAAGNTAMTHFFLGLDPTWMIREPYIPAVNRPGCISAAALGLSVNPRAQTIVFPNAGSYFGGDLIAGIFYAGLHEAEAPAVLIDVGTNAEVVLGNREWLMACAGAAGPALEGGVTRMGMLAGPGVIDQVRVDSKSGEIRVHTLADQPPVGICGSGLIDLAAELFRAGMIDPRGKFVPALCGNRLQNRSGLNRLVVVPAKDTAAGEDLTISQADLDSLIRSKAAMYSILETITSAVGVSFPSLQPWYVAGAFGTFIDPRSAVVLGLLPDLPPEIFRTLGNASLEGAAKALQTPDCVREIDRIRDRVTYLELNVNQDLMNRFSAAKFIPHTDASRFPSVKIGKR